MTWQSWDEYLISYFSFFLQGNANPLSSTNIIGASLYNSKNQGDSSSSTQMHMMPTFSPSFPERPDQPECRYYMNTGTCKYGSDCKFHHPKERIAQSAMSSIGPLGLPSRPVRFYLFGSDAYST